MGSIAVMRDLNKALLVVWTGDVSIGDIAALFAHARQNELLSLRSGIDCSVLPPEQQLIDDTGEVSVEAVCVDALSRMAGQIAANHAIATDLSSPLLYAHRIGSPNS